MRRRDALAVPDLFLGLGVAAGGVAGAVVGYTRYGIVGGALGVPAGAVVGGLALFALCVLLVVAVFVVAVTGAFLTGGPARARKFFRNTASDDGAGTSIPVSE